MGVSTTEVVFCKGARGPWTRFVNRLKYFMSGKARHFWEQEAPFEIPCDHASKLSRILKHAVTGAEVCGVSACSCCSLLMELAKIRAPS